MTKRKNHIEAEEPIARYDKPLDFEQVWKMFQETDRMFQETDKKFQETERLLSKKSKETDKNLNKLEQLFTSQWGKLVESLVDGDLVRLLNKKDIPVERTVQRSKGNRAGINFEFDLIAINRKEIVIVEVKTILRPDDVSEFLERLLNAKEYMPEYADRIIYGAMAYLTADGHSNRMAEKQGLFIIRATGSSASIVNKADFKPKPF
ncbi:MAG: hypothetical protein JW861_05290 [Bacteroidales bacterium]|nr:hypothetical protein [Bacteroidales bacterium]